MKYTLLLVILQLSQQVFAQSIRYHKIQYSSTDLKVVEWNTSDTINGNFVVEKIDTKGRTKELRFYNGNRGLGWPGSGFYGGPIIMFDYVGDEIIETYFSTENQIANDFIDSESEYKCVYSIANDEIVDVKYIYKIDFELNPEDLRRKINHLEFYLNLIQSNENDMNRAKTGVEIFGYGFAQGKLNGKSPKSK